MKARQEAGGRRQEENSSIIKKGFGIKLTGREGWRVRIGVYRIIYGIDDSEKKVIVLDIGHRKDIYR